MGSSSHTRRNVPYRPTTRVHLDALFVLRRMQTLMWILESRGHPAFRDRWQSWAREDLAAIAQGVAACG